jgi:Raf kinase inhibitor-like YbhB/YbcL family protein
MAFRITSPAFADGSAVPTRHTCDGENRSPLLTWSGAPEAARSFVLLMDDPDAPNGTFTHWVLYDIASETTELGENVPEGTLGIAGRNSFGRAGYGGPCPPASDPPHRYRFTLHALDIPSLALSRDAEREQVEAQMNGHVLSTAQLVGTYQRGAGARGAGA